MSKNTTQRENTAAINKNTKSKGKNTAAFDNNNTAMGNNTALDNNNISAMDNNAAMNNNTKVIGDSTTAMDDDNAPTIDNNTPNKPNDHASALRHLLINNNFDIGVYLSTCGFEDESEALDAFKEDVSAVSKHHTKRIKTWACNQIKSDYKILNGTIAKTYWRIRRTNKLKEEAADIMLSAGLKRSILNTTIEEQVVDEALKRKSSQYTFRNTTVNNHIIHNDFTSKEGTPTSPSSSNVSFNTGTHISKPIKESAYTANYSEISYDQRFDVDSTIKYMDNNISLEDRLDLSCVSIVEDNKTHTLKRVDLNSTTSEMIKRFRQCLDDHRSIFSYNTENVPLESYYTHQILLYTFNTIAQDRKKEPFIKVLDEKEEKNQEWNFVCKYVCVLFETIIQSYENMFIKWDKTAKVYASSIKKFRPDFTLYNTDGVEVGACEVKPINTSEELVEDDRVVLMVHLKRMLNRRIYYAKKEEEFVTFGIGVFGVDVELSCMKFKDNDYKAKHDYTYQIIKKVKLPTTIDTYCNMESTLEFLFGFFKLIINSLATRDDIEKPYILANHISDMKPTVEVIPTD